MQTDWDKVLGLAVRRGLLPFAKAREAAGRLRAESTLAEAVSATGLVASAIEDLISETPTVRDPEAPPTLVLPRDGAGALPSVMGATRVMDPLPPMLDVKRIGRYEVRSQIGSGGMGSVYRAFDPELGREVAVKTLRRLEDETRPEAVERFLREARAAAKLRHPGIVSVHEQGTVDGTHYFTMDLVEGCAFDKVLAEGKLPLRERLRILVEVGEALGYAHGQGIIHRDIKPGNVLIDAEGHAHVTDFGLAKDLSSAGITQSGEVMGTPWYMSPEQAEGRVHEMGPASDVFSLGVMLYEILTGGRPFVDESRMGVCRKVVNDDPSPPRKANPDVPCDLETICLKAIDKLPDRRFPNGREFADEVGRWLAGEPIRSRPVSRLERIGRRARKHKAIVIPVAITLLVALAFLVYAVTQQAIHERTIHTLVSRGQEKRTENVPDEALTLFALAKDLDPKDHEAREGYDWAWAHAGWHPLYEGPRAGERLQDSWMKGVGSGGEWSVEGQEIVAGPTNNDGLLVLLRWLPHSFRIEYEVMQEGPKLGDFGCFFAADIRGWQYRDPGPHYATGYFVGIGAEDTFDVMKLIGPTERNTYEFLSRDRVPGVLQGAGRWHRIRVERTGARIRVWAGVADGPQTLVIDYLVERPLRTDTGGESGYFGLQKYYGCYHYRNIRVSAREVDADTCGLRTKADLSLLDFDCGDYASHQERFREVLDALDARDDPSLRERLKNPLLAATSLLRFCKPAGSRIQTEEAFLALRLWKNEPKRMLQGDCCCRATPEDCKVLLARMRAVAPAGTEAGRNFAVQLYQIAMDQGRYQDALDLLPTTDVSPSSSVATEPALLLGLGRWEEAVRVGEEALRQELPLQGAPPTAEAERAASPLAMSSYLAAIAEDHGRAQSPPPAPAPEQVMFQSLLFPLIHSCRSGTPPPEWALQRSETCVETGALALQGLLAGWNGDRKAIVDTWARLAPVEETWKFDLDHPKIEQVPEDAVMYLYRCVARYLGGKGPKDLAERWRICWRRDERVWLDLAMAIRAEQDGDAADAVRLYKCCQDDHNGFLLPQELATEGLKRLAAGH